MTRRTIVVTGASSGIGAVTAQHFAERGDRVIVVGRNPQRTREVAARIGTEFELADFDRFDEVRALGARLLERLDAIDVLLNNAGGLVSKRVVTVDGHDSTLQSNHYSPYLLTRLLLPRITGRVVNTASVASLWGRLDLSDLDSSAGLWRGGWPAYGMAKLAVVMSTKELARRTADTGLEAYSVHPGTVVTGFGSGSSLIRFGTAVTGGRWGATPEEGAAPLIALASDAPVPAASGAYFDRMRPNGRTARQASDVALQGELWERSAEIVGLAK
jgi:NAD(P)-dependent dehydrogenase (short-subunit alcohol dehydrogenase family)